MSITKNYNYDKVEFFRVGEREKFENIIQKLSQGIELEDKEKHDIHITVERGTDIEEKSTSIQNYHNGESDGYEWERNWELLDEETLNLIISHYHKSIGKLNPFKDYFEKLDKEEYDDELRDEMFKPKSEDLEDLIKYTSTISQFFLNPIRRDKWIKKGTWNLWDMIFWNNWTYYRPMYQLWGLEIFKYYDFTINHWDELSELGQGYTDKTISNWFNHDWKLEENHFGVPRVKSFMIDFNNRNYFIDEGKIKGEKLDVPHPNEMFKNPPKMENN